MVNGVDTHHGVCREFFRERSTCVGIGFVKRSRGAANRDADAVSCVEDLADPTDIEIDRVDCASLHKADFVESFPVTRPANIIHQ